MRCSKVRRRQCGRYIFWGHGGSVIVGDEPTEALPGETGQDAKDTAFGTLYGEVEMTYMQVQVSHDDVAPLDHPDPVQATLGRQGQDRAKA